MTDTLITSRSNPWVQHCLRHQAKPALRKAAGWVWLEGEHVLIEALKHSDSERFSIESMVLPDTAGARSLLKALRAQFPAAGRLPCVWLSESVFKALCTMDSAPAVCAVLRMPAQTALKAIDFTQASVVLDGLQDPGNVGTLIRLCAAFGVGQVLLSKGSASAWSAKALRAGQGAQCALAVFEEVDLSAAYALFREHHLPIAATLLAAHSVPLQHAILQPQMVWVFGHEGQGVSADSLAAAGLQVHIPMQGGFESLNVAAACAICLWQWQQQAPKTQVRKNQSV